MKIILFFTSLIIFNAHTTTGFNPFKGIVEVPKLFGKKNPKSPPGAIEIEKGDLKFFQAADPKSKILLEIEEKDKSIFKNIIGKREFEYEYLGLEVYGISDDWYQVEIKDLDFIKKNKSRYVWLRKADTGSFHSYLSLLKSNIAFLDLKIWNGKLFNEPNLKNEVKIKNLDIKNYVDVKVIDKKDNFFKVDIYNSNQCGDRTPKKMGTYWVPATNLKGRPNLWFYMRGC